MKNYLRLEEAFQLVVATYFAYQLPYAWWWYWVFFLTPDVSMLGYLFNTRVGAVSYNLFHHKGIALLLIVAGIYINSDIMTYAGLLLYGHSAFDRMLGYGLKYPDDFKHTHLGWVGKS